jgi:DNA helicase-2/ATP-dependent DNA helicase PcrA
VVVDEGFYGGNAGFRDNANAQEFASTYDSPGWRRAQANRAASGGMRPRPPLIEAQAYAVQTSDPTATQFARGERIFHQKFGYGIINAVEGNKLTVAFDKAGEKKVIDQFVQRA